MALNFLNNGYFAGKVGIGGQPSTTNLNVVGSIGTDDLFMTSTAAGGAGTLFVVNEATQLVTRTAAQVLSDIGGAPATGGSYLPIANPTFTGTLTGPAATFAGAFVVTNGSFSTAATHFQLNTPSGYIQMGAMNTSHAHMYTDRASFYFNKNILVNGTTLTGTQTNITGNAGTVTNGVYTIGNQTIGGTKTFSSTIAGNTSGAYLLRNDGSGLTTQRGSGTVAYPYAINSTTTGLFAANSNANSILTVNKHPGDYYSQLGFSSNGNLYYRSFAGTAINATQAWNQIAFTSSLSGYLPVANPTFTGTLTGPAATITTVTGNLSGNATTATTATTANNVTWANVSSKPQAWLNDTNLVATNPPNTATPSGFYQSSNGSGVPNSNWFNYINVRHSNTSNGHGYQAGMSYYDNNFWFRSYQGSTSPTFQAWESALSSGSTSQTKTGILQSNASMRAPIFYDSTNTAYYADFGTGQIVLGGTGRIQGIDTVSASTDAANKAYVDAHPAGTVTSVRAVTNGTSLGTSNIITTSGTMTLPWAGTSAQYVNGAGNLTTFPTIPQGDITNVSTTSPITGGGSSGSVTIAHAASGATAGSYTHASVTVNATGHVTSISSGSDAQGVTSVATGNGLTGGTITSTGTLSLDRPNSQLGAVLASYGTTAGASGRIRCTAPFNTNTGHMFSIEVTLFTSYTQYNYVVSGYMYSTPNQWHSPKAIYTTTGTTGPDIYVGRNASGKAYISIANGNYTGVLVHNMTRGYQTSLADTYDPWTITVDAGNENSTSVSVTTVYTSANIPAYLPVNNPTFTGTLTGPAATITTVTGALNGNATTASSAAQVTINYNNNSNANYQLLWGSGNNVYGTGGVYVNPNSDNVYATTFTGALAGNASTVTNGVYTIGTQSIGGAKTFTTTPISVTRSTADSSTYLATTAFVKNQGYTANVGDITQVTGNGGLQGGGQSGAVAVSVDYSGAGNIIDSAPDGTVIALTDKILYEQSGNTVNEIAVSSLLALAPQGDITGITAGSGISGGGTSGTVTITNSAPNIVQTTVSGNSGSVAITGYGNSNFTFYQTSGTFAGYSGWANYYIGNHGNGSNYYNTTIIFPFWGSPKYSRITGGTQSSVYDFWTSENLTPSNYLTKASPTFTGTLSGPAAAITTVTATTFSLSGNATNPTTTAVAIYDQSTVGLTLSAHSVELRGWTGSAMARSAFITYNTATFTGTCTATNFILSSDKTLKDKIKDIETKHVDVNWKNFELKSEPGVKRSGVIAQELEKKHPEFVRTNDEGLKSVAYIDLLISKIAELEARLEKAGI